VIKLINWLTKIIVQTIIVAGLTIYLTWVVVHTYVDKLLTKYNMNSEQSQIQFSEFLSQMSASLNILKPSNSNKQAAVESTKPVQTLEPVPSNVSENNSTNDPAQDSTRLTLEDSPKAEMPAAKESDKAISPSPTATKTEPKSTGTVGAPDDSVSVWNQTNKQGNQKDLLMSAEQFTAKKDQLSESDKMKIFTLLMTRLPQEEFQHISTYVEDGVTEAEWTDIQSIVEKYVQPDEYKELQDMLARY
jgi:hypothetical protein